MLDRNLAENISRVLYPNDNVCHRLGLGQEVCVHGRRQERGGTFSCVLVTPRAYCWPLCLLLVLQVRQEDARILVQLVRVGTLEELFPGKAHNTLGPCMLLS